MLIDIQCLPTPMGTDDDPYAFVDAAIAVLRDAGVAYEVHALGTGFETTPDHGWALARAAHDACLAAGADHVVTIVKLAEWTDDAGPSAADLVDPHRPGRGGA